MEALRGKPYGEYQVFSVGGRIIGIEQDGILRNVVFSGSGNANQNVILHNYDKGLLLLRNSAGKELFCIFVGGSGGNILYALYLDPDQHTMDQLHSSIQVGTFYDEIVDDNNPHYRFPKNLFPD